MLNYLAKTSLILTIRPENTKTKKTIFMIGNITTLKEVETALFSALLQEKGSGIIVDYLNTLKVNNVFKERQRYSELKRKLGTILQASKGEQSDLIQELETTIFEVLFYSMVVERHYPTPFG